MTKIGGSIEHALVLVHDIRVSVYKLQEESAILTKRVMPTIGNPLILSTIQRFQSEIFQCVSVISDQISTLNSHSKEIEDKITKFQQAECQL